MSRQSISTTLRERIIIRDFGVCQCCGLLSLYEVHHITPAYRGGTDEEENLIGLCSRCHKDAPNTKEEFIQYKKKGGMGISLVLSKVFLCNTELPPHELYKTTMEIINALRKAVLDMGIEKYGIFLEDLEFIKKQKREEVKNAKITRNKRKILYNLASKLGQAEEVGKEPGVSPDIQ